MFFWQGRAYKIGRIKLERRADDYMAPWVFTDEDGLFNFVMTPFYDNYTGLKLAFINNHCHQVFGWFNGTVRLPEGEIIEVENLQAFCEHAKNQW
jgi:hypothetical protein